MTGATKILTVSYGTFSCTLEGFDDPFSAMQSIAEYFRGLAADDRYFGAVPPTPDAAMLQRIAAQAQSSPKSGQIQTQLHEDGVVLRQTGPDATAPDAPVAPAPVTPAPAAVAGVTPPAPGSVADKLSRIRAVVARSGGDLGGFTDEDSTYFPDAAANAAAAPSAAPRQLDTPPGSDSVNSGYQDEDEDVPSILHASAEVAAQSAAPSPQEADPLSQPVLTAHDSAAAGGEQPDAEKPHENQSVAADDGAANAALVDSQDEAPESDPANSPEEDSALEIAAQTTQIENDLSARIAALRGASAQTDGDDVVAQKDTTTVEISRADHDAYDADDYDGDEEDDDDAAEMTVGGATDVAPAETADPDAETTDFDLDDDEFHAFAKPRVTRSDVAVDRILEKTNTEMNEHEGSRRRSAIAHLKAAVAATRAGAGRDPGAGQEDDTMSQFRDDLAKAVRPRQQSGGPVASGVAAAPPLMLVPSLRVGNAGADTPHTATAAQPRRVANSDASFGEDFVQSDGPVADRFAEFVAQQDARELPEVMEAAAAYATHVEGRPHVTRPLVMSRVLEQNNSVKREDALRTFGRLLRDGRIIRLKRGKFAVAEDTRFRDSGSQ